MKGKGEFSSLTFRNGVKDGVAIGLGYLPVAFAFGVKASLLGVPILITILISLTNLTSAGQLAGLTIIASLGSFIEIILTQLLINSRYFLMSLTLSQKTDKTFTLPNRLLTSAFITDEIFAVSVARPNLISKNYFLGLALMPYIGWGLGTILGALAGDILPVIITTALGIALYAMFIAIVVPPATKSLGVLLTILLSAGVSCLFYYVRVLNQNVTEGFRVIISAIIGAGVMAFIFPIKSQEAEKDNDNAHSVEEGEYD